MNSKILFLILLLSICLLFHGVIAQNEDNTDNNNNDENNNNNNNNNNGEGQTDGGDTVNNPEDKDNPTATDDPMGSTTIINGATQSTTNSTIDGCGTVSSQVGMFSFNKPISKSVLVQYSNFTIIWYYNNIIYDNYLYPTQNITLSLFYEEDANSNNWATSWKKPVWSKTLSMSEIEEGPTLTNNVKSYQWDWKILYDDDERENHGFVQSLRTNEKYKLRISGDGKDLQTNSENFKCYKNGDIMPGSTRAFYIVENNNMNSKYYQQIKIPDSAMTRFMATKAILKSVMVICLLLFIMI